ncbi:MAG: ComEC/Rec2 family competence protein, partial [Thiohalomonadaceae bacterium]
MASWTIAFLLGVITLQRLAFLPDPEWAGGILLFLMLFAAAGSRWARHAFVRRLFLWCVAAALGFAWAYLHATVRLADTLPAELEGVDLQVEGMVVGLPEPDERRLRFLFEPSGLVLNERAHAFRGRLRLAWYDEPPAISPGERWHLTVRLKRPHGMANPGAFDYEAWLFQEGIRATGYVRAAGRNHRLAQPLWWQAPVDRTRAAVRDRAAALAGEAPFAGVLLALAIGDRSGVAPAQWDVFTATGTNHLMAISGLHVGLVALLAGALVRLAWRGRLALYLPAQKAAAGAALVAAALYALLAGFSVPTQRSLVMIAVVALALMAGRPVRPTAG